MYVYNFFGQLLLGRGHAQIASMFEQNHFHKGSDLLKKMSATFNGMIIFTGFISVLLAES